MMRFAILSEEEWTEEARPYLRQVRQITDENGVVWRSYYGGPEFSLGSIERDDADFVTAHVEDNELVMDEEWMAPIYTRELEERKGREKAMVG